MKLYNSLTKKVEEFAPQDNKTVKMYSCGPTVYYRAHIGNFSAYLMSDLIVRWIQNRHFFNSEEPKWEVKKISNITDVGHLVSDGDEGEDKMEKAAREQQKSVLDIARYWEEIYHKDEKKLNILEADVYTRATEHIDQMIELIKRMEENGYTYENEDGVYFSVEKFEDYGKLSGNTLENLTTGAGGRVSNEHQSGKKHPADFALWKKLIGENAKHSLFWDSPWGKGFPGWHIECSAMILATLGEQIDLHTGGEDNIFPHHECEIAQMESATGKKPFCFHWVHKRFIQLNAEKMSKSKGNILSLDDVIEKGFSPLDLRYLFLSVHYRQQLNFTWENLESSKSARNKIQNFYNRVKNSNESGGKQIDITGFQQKFFENMEDDLNVSGALSIIFDLMREVNSADDGLDTTNILEFLDNFNEVFAVLETSPVDAEIPSEIQELADKRAEARANKDFAESDRLRDEIASKGYKIEDSSEGQKIQKA